MNKESVGKLFKGNFGIYECVAYSDKPSVVMKNTITGESVCVVIDSDYAKTFEVIGEKLKPLEDLNLAKIDITKEGQVYGVTKKEIILDIQTIQHWINKTIDAINEMREDK